MKNTVKWTAILLASTLALTACGTKGNNQTAPSNTDTGSQTAKELQPGDIGKGLHELVAEIEKGKDGGKVDYAKAEKIYNDTLKEMVQSRDSEYKDQMDQQITSAIKAGKDGAMKSDVVAELVEKLGEKAFFLSVRHDFTEAENKWSDKSQAQAEIKEAKEHYEAGLKEMVGKRDAENGTQLDAAIAGAFNDLNTAATKNDSLAFGLSKQVVDKSLMKAFYLAVGAEKGYAYKIESLVKEGKDAKAAQAEGWAFYQSIYGYLAGADKEDADFVQKQFDLSTDVKTIKGDAIHQALVRGFANVALNEYKESVENLGKDKGPITAMEGALFVQVIDVEAKKALGEAEYNKLVDTETQYLEAVKKSEKDKVESLHKEIESALNKLAKVGK